MYRFVLLTLALAASPVTSMAAHYQVYLLGGQSNGNGRADAAQLTPPLSDEQTDVRLYYRNTQDENSVLPEDQWINLAPGSGHGTTFYYATEFGPEVSFGRQMADAKPAENIAIIKYTHGGTNLYSQWSATGDKYATFVSTVQAGLAALTTAGHTYTLRGMLWQQGEADTGGTAADNYQANLTSLIARVRTDLNGGVAFPFVIGSLSDSQYSNITTVGSGPYKVRQAQEAVAAADATAGIVITDGYGIQSDGIHFDHLGQVALGQGHASQMLALEGGNATTQLIHHWAFDGDATDSAGSADGTVEGGAVFTTSGGGKFGEAIRLDGVDDAVRAAAAVVPATNYTLSAWVKWEDSNGQRGYIAGGQNGGAEGEIFTMSRGTSPSATDRKLFLNLLPNGATSITESAADSADNTISINAWQHVAYSVHETNGTTLYLNGSVVGTNALRTTHTPSTLSNFSIGARPDSTTINPSWFGGLIDDVAIFDDVLNSEQINKVKDLGAENYNSVTSPPSITALAPDGASGVYPGTNLVATFDQDILAGSGDIVIKDLLDGSTTRTIAVTDSAQVSISGKVLTIDPATSLASDRDYAVQMAAGAVKNFSDLPFAGIPGSDVTTWNFRTLATSPNVIFILGDDQAWYDYSFMYRPSVEKAAIDMPPANYPVPAIYQAAQTPSIDRLADEGICFTHGYTPPLCRPSLASIITGAYPHQTLITGNDPATGTDEAIEARMQVMHPLPRTLADQLGYTSFQTGKWWEGHHTNGGFTAGDTVNSTAAGTAPIQWSAAQPSYVTARHGDWGLMIGRVDYVNDIANPAHPIPYANTIQTATDFMDTQVAADQPFFLWYAPFLPHTPHDPPAGLLSKYDALISEPDESGDYFAKYYANIERFDGGVGALLDYLDTKQIADNTIVVFICDNGWINQANANAFYVRSKKTAYQGGVRTPIIVRWPDRIKAGGAVEPQFVTTPVSLVDLVPTIHDALGLATFPEMTGVSLLRPDLVAARDTIFTEDSKHDIADLNDPLQTLQARVAIRDGWKLILPFDNATRTNGAPELYHLYDTSTGTPVDPHEDTNLAASNSPLVGELTTAIEDWYNDRFGCWIAHPSRGLALADRGFDADPDGDRLANGLEAWFGTRPDQFDTSLTALAVDGTTFTFSHPRNEDAPSDLSGFYEWSPNLVDWYAGDGVEGTPGGLTVGIVPGQNGSTTTVTATPSGTEPSLFFRAGVAQMP